MDSISMEDKIRLYPAEARIVAERIRILARETAQQEQLGPIQECLKWGEPSFAVKNGSPFRMDWKESTPEKFYLFFNCRTSLIGTFREMYHGALKFQGTRAIVLSLGEELPESILRHCISLAMHYHSIKHLPLLGA